MSNHFDPNWRPLCREHTNCVMVSREETIKSMAIVKSQSCAMWCITCHALMGCNVL